MGEKINVSFLLFSNKNIMMKQIIRLKWGDA